MKLNGFIVLVNYFNETGTVICEGKEYGFNKWNLASGIRFDELYENCNICFEIKASLDKEYANNITLLSNFEISEQKVTPGLHKYARLTNYAEEEKKL